MGEDNYDDISIEYFKWVVCGSVPVNSHFDHSRSTALESTINMRYDVERGAGRHHGASFERYSASSQQYHGKNFTSRARRGPNRPRDQYLAIFRVPRWLFSNRLFLFLGRLGGPGGLSRPFIVFCSCPFPIRVACTHTGFRDRHEEAVHPAPARIYTQFSSMLTFLSSTSRATCGF